MLADFMDAENGIIVNLHIQSIDHNEAIKTIKRKITDLDRMKIEEQKKAIRSGYDTGQSWRQRAGHGAVRGCAGIPGWIRDS